VGDVAREISQRELRNDNAQIMRAVEAGESFVVTRNGTPVAELVPVGRPHFVDREVVLRAFRNAPPVDYKQFRADLDAVIDQDPTPRG
jgi:prevent-host-death family protein